jgi:hypothetical protein
MLIHLIHPIKVIQTSSNALTGALTGNLQDSLLKAVLKKS